MSSFDGLPGKINRKKFIRALRRLGFVINTIGGKGSHYKIIWPANQKSVTIQSKLRKDVLRYVLKELESISGIGWEDIQQAL